MLRTTFVELLEGRQPEVLDPVRDAVEAVRAEVDLPEPRVSKVGRRLVVEVDFVLEEGAWDIAGEDRVRRAADRRLDELPDDVWLTVELTADPALAV